MGVAWEGGENDVLERVLEEGQKNLDMEEDLLGTVEVEEVRKER